MSPLTKVIITVSGLHKSLEKLKILFTLVHISLTKVLIEVCNQSVDLITNEGKVQAFKLTENLLCEHEVDTVYLSSAAAYISRNKFLELLNNTVTESKTEVAINRITAESNLRTFERVPAGASFSLNMVLNIFEGEDEAALKKTLMQAIRLLEDDYLGGHGSRGYGQVKIELDRPEGEVRVY